jgi:hypothetical protein
MSQPNREIYEPLVVELLSHVYRAVDWRKAAGSKFRWDVWNHRVRAAATRGTLGAFTSRLANYFGLQSLPPEAIAVLEELRPYEAEVLDLIYTEHVPIAMAAVVAATGRRKGGSDDRPTLFTD